MKKILTLALALALVFAIAAPAFAITGDVTPEETNTAVAPVQLSLGLFTAAPNKTGFGGFQISEINKNKLYVVNEVAFYGAAVKFTAPAEGQKVVLNPADYEGAVLAITYDAVALDKTDVQAYVFKADGSEIDVVGNANWTMKNNTWKVPTGTNTWNSGNVAYFFSKGIVTGKGVVDAELAKVNDLTIDNNLIIRNAEGEDLYTVDQVSNGFGVWKASDMVFFEVANGDVTGIFVQLGSPVDAALAGTRQQVTFSVPVSGKGSVAQTIGAFKDADLAAAKKVYDEVMAFFGFNYDAEGKLLDKHFEAKSTGLLLKADAAVNLYAADITNPGGVTPPQTGDVASTLGFVMIAVAMIAAGVVVTRKVKA